ncbi:MAG: hypothetical protein HQ490_01520 [Lutibacter sp.]|jgi:uncharacterized lipoprotein|nr:hypothetical protein [Lutibacter sp.]
MNKSTLNTLLLALVLILFASCGSSKKGCGLTSDAQKMEQTTTTTATNLAKV